MSNPTREDVERLFTDEGLKGAYWDELAMRVAQSYRRALDMQDEMVAASKLGAYGELHNAVCNSIKKFDGGVLEEARRCSHGIPRKECGSDE